MTDPPLRKSGRPALVSLLPSGEVRSAAVVRRLDMSVRTFTRNLAAKGMTFAEILKPDLNTDREKETSLQCVTEG